MKPSAGFVLPEIFMILLLCVPVVLLFLWGHKRYLKDKEKQEKKAPVSAAKDILNEFFDRYYLDIPPELGEWAKTQGAFQEHKSGKFYVVSQQIKDRIIEKLEQPFYKKAPIMTRHEAENYRHLYEAATPLGLEVFTKVRMLDLLEPIVDQSSHLFKHFIRIIWSKHVDFVVWSPNTESVICIVELDDFSHQQEDRKRRDKFVEMMFVKSGYVYLHYSTIYQDKMYHKLLSLKKSQGENPDNCF